MRLRSLCVTLILGIILTSSITTRAQDTAPLRHSPYPLPPLEPITAANANRIEQLAFVGNGMVSENLFWSPDGDRLIAETMPLDSHYIGPNTRNDSQNAWMILDTFNPPTPPRLEYLPPNYSCPIFNAAQELLVCK